MADAKISQLPVATTPLAGSELVPLVQGGTTKQTTVDALLTGTVLSGNANGLVYLDASKAITSSASITSDGTNIQLGLQGDMRFADADSSNWVAFQAPATVASNVTWTLPSTDGTPNQSLVTNGSGVLSWASAALSASGSNTQVQFNDSSAFAGDANFTWDKVTGTLAVVGSIVENSLPVVVQADIGTAPNEIPLNQYLGSMAYQNADSVKVGTLVADYIYATNNANISSFTWNTATSSPAAVTGITAPVVTAVHAGMRRCVINDSGVVQYYLDPFDSTLKANGTAATLTGADGQVMVEIPRFYTRRTVNGTLITWEISPVPMVGFTVHPAFVKDGVEVPFRYYGAYDACVYDDSAAAYISGLNYDNNSGVGNGVEVDTATDKLASVSGVYPMVGLDRSEFRAIAANRGTGWRQLDWTLFSAVQLLYLIEFQSFYSQNIIGAGNTTTTYASSSGTQSDNGGSEAGKSNSIGNASTNTTNGASSASRGVAWMSYRGIENFYGNAWNWADGCIVNPDGTVSAGQGDWWFTNNSADFSDTARTNMTQIMSTAPTTSGYVSAIASVDNFFIATSVSGGSSTTYLTDYYYGTTSADRVVRVGGSANDSAFAGLFYVDALSASSARSRAVGARLAF